MKASLEDSLVHYPLERGLCFKSFENLKVVSLYWFAAQQQTSTLTRQKFGLFYRKLNVKFNELILNVQK